MPIRALLPLLFLCTPASIWCQETSIRALPSPLHRIDLKSSQDLRALFRHSADPLPIVSAHRGGPAREFPENCIATFEHTLRHTFAILEIDPRYTQDGSIVLHHDADLKRTTTGKGLVADHTLAELKELKLKDTDGQITDFQIPTLDEVLDWARGKTILVLDQKDVPVAARVREIAKHKAEAYAMIIVYSYEEAKECYSANPNIMMEVMIPSREMLERFNRTGVPWSNVVAFVGHTPPHDPSLYSAIHERGARCIVGSSRNLDRQIISREVPDIKQLETDYRSLLKRGADLIETDIPVPLGSLLYGEYSPQETNSVFYLK